MPARPLPPDPTAPREPMPVAPPAATDTVIDFGPAEPHRRAVADHVPHPVWLATPDGRLVYANPRCLAYTGLSLGELLTREWVRLLHPEDAARAAEDWDRAGGGPHEAEYRLRGAGGAFRWHLVRWVPVTGGYGAVVRWLATCVDVDDYKQAAAAAAAERRRLEDLIAQAQKMEAVGRLVGGVAHDFNNLLTVINGYADILAASLPAGAAGGMIAEVRRSGVRAADLTRRLLAFSRRKGAAPAPLDPNAVIADMGTMLRRMLGEDVQLTTDLRPGLPPVLIDPSQLEQVILNLAVNARDAMPHGGRLTITTGPAGPDARIEVADTGFGMSAAVKARIFEPFFTTKGAGKGTGLGLATVHGIVTECGGRIEVESLPGRGTTFRVLFPGAAPVAEPEPAAPAALPDVPGGTETVLLVEDDDAVRGLAREVLRAKGYTVVEAGDGEEATAVCSSHPDPIHILVADVVMPGVSGRELIDRLLSLRPRMAVLCVSGYPEEEVVRRGVYAEGFNYLQKPFTLPGLAQKVRGTIDFYRNQFDNGG